MLVRQSPSRRRDAHHTSVNKADESPFPSRRSLQAPSRFGLGAPPVPSVPDLVPQIFRGQLFPIQASSRLTRHLLRGTFLDHSDPSHHRSILLSYHPHGEHIMFMYLLADVCPRHPHKFQKVSRRPHQIRPPAASPAPGTESASRASDGTPRSWRRLHGAFLTNLAKDAADQTPRGSGPLCGSSGR